MNSVLSRRIVVAGVLCLAGSAASFGQGLGNQEAELVESEISQNGKTILLVNYEDQLYRLIEPNDLKSLALDDAPLHGLLVCVEGKFDRFIPPNIFRVIGSDRAMVVLPKQRSLIAGIMRGDNVWVGGMAQRMSNEPACYLAVKAVVRLGSDMDLFQKRFEQYRAEAKWQRLIELGTWIERSGQQAAGARFEDFDRYRVLKDRAYRQALQLYEQKLPQNDPEELYKLARMYMDLLARAGRLPAIERLLKAVEIDPTHDKSSDMLVELGYVLHKGRWITEAERKEIEKEERAKAEARARALAAAQMSQNNGTSTAVEETREALPLDKRLVRISELETKIRVDEDGLDAMTAQLPELDDAVASRMIWILANTGGTVGLDGLLRGLRSRSIGVRKEIADALAGTGELEDLADVIKTDRSAAVRVHAVGSLASVRTSRSTGKLVSLLGSVDDTVRFAIVGELKRITDVQFDTTADWNSWWEEAQDDFKGLADD